MENKINITKLLKDCPKGMEFDCTMYDSLYFDLVDNYYNDTINCYTLIDGIRTSITFTKYGTYNNHTGAKCVIFPKGKTTWEGFVPPCKFKDGDIVVNILGSIYIYKAVSTVNFCGSYASVNSNGVFISHYTSFLEDSSRYATEEEKQKLFDAIKANGYKWNEETKTLEKLPKFKVGNRIKYINGKNKDGVEQGVILSLTNDTYDVAVTNDMGIFIPISEQDDWELVPNKFDITTLKAFESKVLVRDINTHNWIGSFYSHYEPNGKKFYIIGGSYYLQCIPYEGNEHLLGTTDDCDDFYKTWE